MIVIGGSFRLAQDRLAAARPHLEQMIGFSRSEDGCITYSYAADLLDPELFHVYEIWRDWPAFEAHRNAPNMAAWRIVRDTLGMTDRNLTLYEVDKGIAL